MSVAYKGTNYGNTQSSIPSLIDEGLQAGKRLHMYDKFVLTADLASGDTILMGSPLPAGAILWDCIVTSEALGGSCTVNVGWQAGASGVEAADATGFFSALPVSSATVAKAHGSAYEGDFYGHQLKEAAQVVIAENAVSSGATGKKIQIDVEYSIGL